MLHANICPLCGEPLDENGDCTACSYYHGREPEPLDEVDLALLHFTDTSSAGILAFGQ